ncbi:hypothetical protein GGR54DRAFT_581426 [Hypoxylon sp. NC1633]|nr:hypothetical protein GGR54DRAFT_581426 [Hypoxylon sp. NC1633]
MSRSLEKDLLAHLKADDPAKVYRDISTIFTELPDGELLEIEFLGKSHPLQQGVNYLRDGMAVAIPKLRLIQAFFVARQILHSCRGDIPVNHDEVMGATAVMLLMDPEHLTAANTRKRLLLSTMESNKSNDFALRREKRFLDSLLTSRLHRHTKSPVLWSHRRWLLRQFAVHDVPIDLQHDIKNVVMTAGTWHIRNYPAWHHARFLLDQNPRLATLIVDDVKDFCLSNHSDISTWSFLSYTIDKIEDSQRRREICSSVLAEVLRITESLRWTNESVWVFLRNSVATGLVDDGQYELFLATNRAFAATTANGSGVWRNLDGARRWSEMYRLPIIAGPSET